MIVLIGIEGAEGDARIPNSSYTGSFIYELVNGWSGSSEYIRGPSSRAKGIMPTATIAMQRAAVLYNANRADGLILAGYSRGGAAAIVAAQLLQKTGIVVDYMALFDAIERDPSVAAGEIGANVLTATHARRSQSADSRPLWGNCGLQATNNLLLCSFHVTHWGASGVPRRKGIPPGKDPTDFVTEPDLIQGGQRQTGVTWQQEIDNTTVLKNFMHQHMVQACQRIRPGKGGGVRQHTVSAGQTLSSIAGYYWQDVLLWPLLHDANKITIGSDPNQLKIGQLLIVPDLQSFTPGQISDARKRGRQW